MEALDQFRQETRAWLEANCPESQRSPAPREEQVWAGREQTFPTEDAKLWFERIRDKGWITPGWPKEYGGADLSPAEVKILEQEMKRLKCRTPLFDLGLWMFGPALLECGNDAQKAQHLPKISRGEIRWCQGFSEPGAGSDLASLQCKAEDKGDHFLVNGSKIWTSGADKSDWIFCLVRTDPEAKKQQGISFLVIDMQSEGVSVTPIELISGESEFCQTFFDNVKVPKENLIGELNDGWSVAKAVLKHERKLMSELGSEPIGPSFTPQQAAIDYVGLGADGKLSDSSLRGELIRNQMKMHAIGLTGRRMFEEGQAKVADPRTALIMKYVGTEENKRQQELILSMLGTQALGWEGEEFSEDELLALRTWANSKALTIAGGASEIQLNIIAKRALGLPD